MSTRIDTRIAARLQFLDDDPLDYWDYGMLYAFDVIEAKVQELVNRRELLTVAGVLRIIDEQRAHVQAEDLHAVHVASGPPQETIQFENRECKWQKPKAKNKIARSRP
jgi:hypothetical protein